MFITMFYCTCIVDKTFTQYNKCIHSLLLYSALKTLNSKGWIFTGFGVHVFCGVAHSGYHHVYGHVLLLYILLHQRSWEWLWRYRRTNHWGKERRHSTETFQSSQAQVISSWSKYWDKAICQRVWKNGISDVYDLMLDKFHS